MPDRPNILLIATDTQCWDTLRCMPGEPAFVRSPNLDALAAEGVLFQNAHTSSPVCMPARCSLMTGVYTSFRGCVDARDGQITGHTTRNTKHMEAR